MKHKLSLDLHSKKLSIVVKGRKYHGKVSMDRFDGLKDVLEIMEGLDVDHYLRTLDLNDFSPDKEQQERLRCVSLKHRDIFKGNGKVKGSNTKFSLSKMWNL